MEQQDKDVLETASREPGVALREDVELDDIAAKLKEADEAGKRASDAASLKAKAEAEAAAHAAAMAALPDDPRIKALSEALKISEEARRRAEATREAEPVRAAPAETKELTREEINELYTKDPVSAI